MKLYEAPSPNARRVHVFLAEKGLEIDREQVDLRSAENLGEEHLRRNPAGRVPVLELDDGSFLSESVAICRYLDAVHPEPALFGSTPEEIGAVEMWNRRAELNFLMNVAMGFRNLTGFFKDRETCVEEWGQVAAETAASSVAMFDDHLASNRFLAGDTFTVADITFGVGYEFAQRVKVVPLPESPNVARYLSELGERASWGAS
ncbi:MAG: glutathione S-transferase family protein [Acidobacteriota bacterium]